MEILPGEGFSDIGGEQPASDGFHAKLGMMREALAKLARDANERSSNFRLGTLE